MKKLLLSALALLAVVTTNAQTRTTIWEGEEPCVFDESWGNNFGVDKSMFADVKAGDKLIFTCSPEPEPVEWEWGSQVLVKTDRAGWGTLTTINVNQEGEFAVTIDDNEITVQEPVFDEEGTPTGENVNVTTSKLQELINYGLRVQGIDATVSKVELEIVENVEPIDPNAVWHGEAEIGWNENISVAASKFENAKVGDQIIVKFNSISSGNQMMLYSRWVQIPGSRKGNFVEGESEFVTNITTAGLAVLKTGGMFVGGSGVTVTDILLVEGEAGPENALWYGEAKYNQDGHANWVEFYTTKEVGENNYVEIVLSGVPTWKQFANPDWTGALPAQPVSEEYTSDGIKYIYKMEDVQDYLNDFIYQVGGEVTLKAINMIYMEPIVCIDLDPVYATGGWGDREYDTTTFDGKIIGDGAASGWWLAKDYSDFDKVYLELSAINVPEREVDGEMQAGYAQLFVQCGTGEEGETSNLTCGFGTHLYAVVDFDELKNQTRQIVIQGSAGVTFTIAKACVCTNEYFEENILPNLPADPAPSGATAIETINNEQADNAWYTLEGVRVMAPVKGLYIHNGKKVMVK